MELNCLEDISLQQTVCITWHEKDGNVHVQSKVLNKPGAESEGSYWIKGLSPLVRPSQRFAYTHLYNMGRDSQNGIYPSLDHM